jgi:uncharacterized membrane protein
MKASRKPGIVSFIVVTLVTALIFWAGVEGPKELFVFLAVVFLWFVWFSGWRRHRKLAGQIEELSATITAVREEAVAGGARPEVQGAPLQAASAVAAASAAAASGTSSVTAPAPTAAAYQSGTAPPPPPPPMTPAQAAANLTFAQVETAAQPDGRGLFARLRSLLKFEELLGTNLFAKIGALLLVVGVAYGLSMVWKNPNVGPWVRVAMGALLGATLLGAGIVFERKERYLIVARAGVAAGWAILFSTAFAMNHIPAAKVLPSEVADMLLMFVVAGAMVLHTLRYRSQVATGLAFLSAFAGLFASVFPSKEFAAPDVYSLTAAVVLAASVAMVALRMQWFVLEVCAIVATFLNHFVWLIHIIRPMGKHHQAFPEFLPSAAILVSYWLVFRFSYLWRREGEHERVSALAALLNTGLLLAVLKYQAVHPEYAFWALLALGSIELGLGQLAIARRRSMPHIVLTVIGACLLMTAIPFRVQVEAQRVVPIEALYVSLIWLAEAEAFFLVGVLTREKVFRRVGLFAFVPLVAYLIGARAANPNAPGSVATVLGVRMDGAIVKGEFAPAVVTALVALVLYLNVHWAPRRWAAQFESTLEKIATRDLSYAAALLAFAAGWMACPLLGAAVCWMGLACALASCARRADLQPLRVQSLLIAAFAFLRVLVVNLPSESKYHVGTRQWPARLLTVVAIVVLGYLAAYWHRAKSENEDAWLRWLEPGFSWAASTMLTLLLWYELSSASVALGWGMFALLMFEIGARRRSLQMRVQAYVAGVCTFLRLLFVNLNATSAERFGPRVYTIVPLALLFFYLYWRLEESEQAGSLSSAERKLKAAESFAWLGTTTIVLMLRFEPPLDWVAAAWAAAVFALMALAWWTQRRVFAHQAMLLSLGVLFRGVMHNLYERSYFTPESAVLSNLSTISAVAFLFASLFFAFKLQLPAAEGERKNWLARAVLLLDAHPEQALFFVPLALITAYLAVELRSGVVTMAWALEAVLVFMVALWIGERSYRISAMGLLLLCVGKVAVIDFWSMARGDKAITFVVLGGLLLGVPILYSKNREKLRQFL